MDNARRPAGVYLIAMSLAVGGVFCHQLVL